MDIASEDLTSRVTVVRCTGKLTLVTASSLKALIDHVVNGGHPQVVVDLGGVEFIDSTGLGALIGGLKKARQAGGDLRIAGSGTQVSTVLQLTNLDRVLRPYVTVTDATREW
jgi:anti-sigma B factor antagonist